MSIYKKLLNIQQRLKVSKTQYNIFGKYKYRSTEDILESVKGHLLEEGLTIIIKDEIININDRYYVKAIVNLIDIETGDTIEASAFAREEESKKGMDGSQVTGASSSYARKYALNGLFAIDDTKDSDATNTHDKSNNKPIQVSKPNNLNKIDTNNSYKITEKQVKFIFGKAKEKGIEKSAVMTIIKKLYNKDNADDLNKAEFDAILKRIENK